MIRVGERERKMEKSPLVLSAHPRHITTHGTWSVKLTADLHGNRLESLVGGSGGG